MSRYAILPSALAMVLAALPLPTPAETAGDGVLLRCRTPDGTVAYTDRSCAIFGARAEPIDAETAMRIARDNARHAALELQAAMAREGVGFDMDDAVLAENMLAESMSAMDNGGTSPSFTVPGRRSPASGCAHDPSQLATDLHASIALGDVNRIAESYHFAGMSTAAGERVLDRLQEYAGHAVVDSSYYAGLDADGRLRVVLAGADGGATAVDFEVERYSGCYFVSFA